MTLSIGISFEFTTDGRRMTPQGLSDLGLRAPGSPRLPDVKPFFMADMLIVVHQWISCSDKADVVTALYTRYG
jgi:hypothetical protein